MNNVIVGPWNVEVRPRQRYGGPKINRKRRKLAIQTILDQFDPQGIRALMIIGIPYNSDEPYSVSQCGGEPYDWRIALDDLHDLTKFPPEEDEE